MCPPERCDRPAVTLADRLCDGHTMQGSSISAVHFEQSAHGVAPGSFPLVRGEMWSGAGSNRRPSAFQKLCCPLSHPGPPTASALPYLHNGWSELTKPILAAVPPRVGECRIVCG